MLNGCISGLMIIPFNITYSERKYGDCRTKAFKQVFDHYGFEYSVQEIFGIGRGLAFSTIECQYGNIPLVGIEGRDFNAELEFCKQCGIHCQEHYIEKNNNIMNEEVPFEQEILNCVKTGNPVLVQCDVYYMTYLKRMNRTHNEFHMITIIGYDIFNKRLFVVDSLLNEVKEISMIELYNAMFEKQNSNEKRGIWYSINKIDNQGNNLSKYERHEKAIRALGERLLSSNGDLHRLKELIEFMERILVKAKKNSTNHFYYLDYLVRGICYIVRQQDELNGSCFRTLYLQYLYDIIKKYQKEELDSIVLALEQSEKIWKNISYKLRYSKDGIVERTKSLINYLKQIYDFEYKAANCMIML